MKKEEIETNLNTIKEAINQEAYTSEEKDAKLTKMSILSALAAETQAKAGALYREKLADAIRILAKEKYQASIIKNLAEGEVSEYSMLYEWAQRCSAAVTHTIEALRTQISLYKTELSNQMFQK
jgi:hypothetical protein